MIAVVFVVCVVVMAGLKLLSGGALGLDALSWSSYGSLMGIVATVSTALSFFFARHQTNKLTLNSNPHSVALVLKAVNHVTGNLMNQIQFVKQHIESEGALSESAATQIDDAIEEAQAGLVVLNGVQDNADEKAYADIYPQ